MLYQKLVYDTYLMQHILFIPTYFNFFSQKGRNIRKRNTI